MAAQSGTNTAAFKQAAAAEVSITLEKNTGSVSCEWQIDADSAESALTGLAALITECAKLLQMTPLSAVARLAAMLAPPHVLNKRRRGAERGEDDV